ncbi:MAG: L,D-transpeptidase family protein [Tissierellia bacterium]|nr:L,D-transpeptidase family protein [Tissierellia bacterium]
MKRFIKSNAILLLVILLLGQNVFADKFVRQNNFLNEKSGSERTAQIKKFQAINNLQVDGALGQRTKDLLYNEELIVYDIVENPPTKDYWIVVNKSRRSLTLYKGNAVVQKYAVALGTSETPTPSAKGKISSKVVNPAWGGMGGKYTPRKADDPLNPLGERWLGLDLGKGLSGYGIHGNIVPNSIGKYVSNGCVRMFNYDIETEVFPKVGKGTIVWMGTDEELASWGVRQLVDKQDLNAKPTPEVTPVPNPNPTTTAETPSEVAPVEEEKIEVVDFDSIYKKENKTSSN